MIALQDMIANYLAQVAQQIWGLPSLLFIAAVAVYITIELRWIQIHYFMHSFRLLFKKTEQKAVAVAGDLTPLQAFINTLGSNIGNGCLAGTAVALCSGGPGAVFWMLLLGMLSMSLRFAEVFLGTYYIGKININGVSGGPTAYMSRLPGGIFWSYLFVILATSLIFIISNMVQCQTIGLTMEKSFGLNAYVTAFFVLAFMSYIFLGGAARIIYIVDRLVPFKVALFLITVLIVLGYNYATIPHALYLIFASAFKLQSFVGGAVGYTLLQVIASGFKQEIFASEAGLGTAAIAFGATETKDAVRSGILAMFGVFITIYGVCFLVALSLLSSGLWNNGETSSALIVSVYETVFGAYGKWIVCALVINFAMSVVVSSAYNGRKCWDFLFAGKYVWVFALAYSLASFAGTVMSVGMIWALCSVITAMLQMVNLLGLLWSVSVMKQELKAYRIKHG